MIMVCMLSMLTCATVFAEGNKHFDDGIENLIVINGKSYNAESFSDRVKECTYSCMDVYSYINKDGDIIEFTYDGTNRTEKKTKEYTVKYLYDEKGRICSEVIDGISVIEYLYDKGEINAFVFDGEIFNYNIEDGIIIGIMDENESTLCKYVYGEYGAIIDVLVDSDKGKKIANANHIRYRGYFYDVETEQYFIPQGGYYNPLDGTVYGMQTHLDIQELFGDQYEHLLDHNSDMSGGNRLTSAEVYQLMYAAAQYYENEIGNYTSAQSGNTWYTGFTGTKQYHLTARIIFGENTYTVNNTSLPYLARTDLKYNRQGIGWVIANRYLEDAYRRSNSLQPTFSSGNTTSLYSIVTYHKNGSPQFGSLNASWTKAAMSTGNEAYQEAFWVVSCLYVCNGDFEKMNAVVPRPAGVSWQCYNKGNLNGYSAPNS